MRIDIATLFPQLCDSVMSESIIGRARKKELFELHCHQIRDYTLNKQKQVDDYPYGGGCGMVMNAQPIYDCCQEIIRQVTEQGLERPHIVFMTAAGQPYSEEKARQLAQKPALLLVCGHWDGLLEYPQYTRPEVWRDKAVPPVLLTGHHANIQAWRSEQAKERTRLRRPDLWEKYQKDHPPEPEKKRRRK